MNTFNKELTHEVRDEIRNTLGTLYKIRKDTDLEYRGTSHYDGVHDYKKVSDTLKMLLSIDRSSSGHDKRGTINFYKCVQKDIEIEIKAITSLTKTLLKNINYESHRNWVISLERLVSLHKRLGSDIGHYE
jgi:hypothetical protein